MAAVLAIDPGLTGALALYVPERAELTIHDMPVRADGKRTEVDTIRLAHIVGEAGTASAVLERVGSMPRQGLSSAFNFGDTYGAIRGVLEAQGYTVTRVTPATWKFQVGIQSNPDATTKTRKSTSRALAAKLFPSHAHLFARVKDDGRAEAALMAWWFVHKRSSK